MTRGRPAAAPRPARGLQRPALDRAHRRPVALPARPTSRRGRRSTSRPSAGSPPAASRRWSTTCGRCCARRRAATPSRRRSILDGRTLRGTPESGHRAGYDGHKRTQGSQAPRRRRHPRAPAGAARHPGQRRRSGRRWAPWPPRCRRRPAARVELAFVDQGYTGRRPGRGGRGPRHRAGGRQAAGGQEGLRAAAPALGGGALLRLGGALPPPGQGLRTVARRRSSACISSPSPA